MSSVIVTTREDLAEILRDIMPTSSPMISEEAQELEVIKRKETLTTDEVQKLYGLNSATLRKYRVDGEGPEYIKHGRLVLYTHKAVKAYLDAGRMRTV